MQRRTHVKARTYGAEGIGRDDPLELGLVNIEVSSDGGKGHRHGGQVRGLMNGGYINVRRGT